MCYALVVMLIIVNAIQSMNTIMLHIITWLIHVALVTIPFLSEPV